MKRALACVLVLAACRPPVPEACKTNFSFSGALRGDFVVAGEVLEVRLQTNRTCPASIAVSAEVTVLDPRGDTVFSGTAEAVGDGSGTGTVTTIRSPTTVPGIYQAVARFQPNLGLVQAEFPVAEERRDAGPVLELPDAGAELLGCGQLDLSEGGQLLCLSGPEARMFSRDGERVATLPGTAARAGAVFWVVDATGAVSRWLERPDGGGFDMAPLNGAVTPNSGLTGPVVPEELEAFYAPEYSGYVHLSVPDAGPLVARRVGGGSGDKTRALWREGSAFVSWDTGLCVGSLDTLDGGGCPAFLGGGPSGAVGNERAGMWLRADVFSPLSLEVLGHSLSLIGPNGTTRNAVLMPPDWDAADAGSTIAWDTGARIVSRDGRQLLVKALSAELRLQQYPALPLVSVTSRWAAFKTPGGALRIYAR